MQCTGRTSNNIYECSIISDDKYWKILKAVRERWSDYVQKAERSSTNIADLVSGDYKISYAVGADIAQSISLSNSIGG